MSFGIDFRSILEAFWHHFLYFSVTDFSMNLRWHFLWILEQNGLPKTTPGGPKNSIPLVGFRVASSLATLALKGVLRNLILATRGSQKGAPERHFGCSFLHLFFPTCLQEDNTAVTQKTWIKQ
jgi:hypothetical protein